MTSTLVDRCGSGRVGMVSLFLELGAEVDATKADGTTALFWAVREGVVENQSSSDAELLLLGTAL